MSVTSNSEGFRLTGRHVLAIIVAFFGVIFAVNATMIYLAVGTFPGAVTASSYRASQDYNGEIASAQAQAARGWQVDEAIVREASGRAVLTVTIRDRAGAPVDNLALSAALQHPVKKGADLTATLDPAGAGRYVGRFDGVEAGQWTLALEGLRGPERVWRSENRAILR